MTKLLVSDQPGNTKTANGTKNTVKGVKWSAKNSTSGKRVGRAITGTFKDAKGLLARSGSAGTEPEDGVFEQLILKRGVKNLVAMAHVEVQHFIPGICPDDRNVTAAKPVFFTEWILAGVEGDEDFYVFIEAGVGIPPIPFVNRAGVFSGQAEGHGVECIIDQQPGGHGGPAIVFEDGSAEEADEPGPVRIGIIVSGYMETQPGSAIFDVLFKSRSLCAIMWKIVEPENELV